RYRWYRRAVDIGVCAAVAEEAAVAASGSKSSCTRGTGMTDEAERGAIDRLHERTDINPKYVAAFAAILVCVTVVLYVLVWGVFDHFAARVSPAPARPSLEGEPQVFPSPRLQVDPQQDLEQLRRRERELLDRYGWVDRDAGI